MTNSSGNDKKITLVTGANKGLGFEISRQLAKQGVTVLIGARDQTKGTEVAKILQDQGLNVRSLQLDVTDISSITTVAKKIEEDFGKLDSKTALNAFTVTLAYELKGTAIKVNSADPGWVQTDMGSAEAPGTVEEGADTPVWLATLPEDDPTGGFFNSRKPIPW